MLNMWITMRRNYQHNHVTYMNHLTNCAGWYVEFTGTTQESDFFIITAELLGISPVKATGS